jgi:hypothetical protein
VFASETGVLPAWRTTFEGTVTSKSVSRSAGQYSLMQLKLSGVPFVFSSGGYARRAEPRFAALQNGAPVRVTVLTIDLRKAQHGQATTVPILLIDQHGSYVFASEGLLTIRNFCMAALAVALFAILRMLAWPAVGRMIAARIEHGVWARRLVPFLSALSVLDRIPRAITAFLVPTIACDPPQRHATHATCLAFARFIVTMWSIVGTAFVVIVVASVLNAK